MKVCSQFELRSVLRLRISAYIENVQILFLPSVEWPAKIERLLKNFPFVNKFHLLCDPVLNHIYLK